ncbi:MAG: transposase, partial [Anaerolineales bacterium]|nr:transposase [Anaerolineales bacterium]
EDWPPVRSGQRFAPNFSRESSPAQPRPPLSPAFESSLTDVDDPLAVTVKSSAAQSSEVTPSLDEIAETRPGPAASAIASDTMEPVSPSVFNLKYACLLIPRFAHHRLVGDLARNLGKWVEEICVAFGWRLESISVRPEYLQWVVSVPPVSSPGYLMRIMRQHTSERIFADFPRLARENPSGDFWAPGYLIMGGAQPPPPHLIKNFIAQTRHRQGISQQLHT